MQTKARELLALDDEKLKEIGERGKDRREEEDEAEIKKLREKHHVQ